MSERWAQKLNLDKLEQIKSRLAMTEIYSSDGGPFHTITNDAGDKDLGMTRVLVSDGLVKKVVYHAITNEIHPPGAPAPFLLDSHMVFAFTDESSPIPHWTFDSVFSAPFYAMHLDLLPRVDLASHRPYMDYVFGHLNETFAAGKSHPGLSEAQLTPRQRSIMSQWMLAYRVHADNYPDMNVNVQAYLDWWFELVENGLPQEVLDSIQDTDLDNRDSANRAMIFNREVDPVWDLIGPMVGDRQSELLRAQLETNEVVYEVPADFKVPARTEPVMSH